MMASLEDTSDIEHGKNPGPQPAVVLSDYFLSEMGKGVKMKANTEQGTEMTDMFLDPTTGEKEQEEGQTAKEPDPKIVKEKQKAGQTGKEIRHTKGKKEQKSGQMKVLDEVLNDTRVKQKQEAVQTSKDSDSKIVKEKQKAGQTGKEIRHTKGKEEQKSGQMKVPNEVLNDTRVKQKQEAVQTSKDSDSKIVKEKQKAGQTGKEIRHTKGKEEQESGQMKVLDEVLNDTKVKQKQEAVQTSKEPDSKIVKEKQKAGQTDKEIRHTKGKEEQESGQTDEVQDTRVKQKQEAVLTDKQPDDKLVEEKKISPCLDVRGNKKDKQHQNSMRTCAVLSPKQRIKAATKDLKEMQAKAADGVKESELLLFWQCSVLNVMTSGMGLVVLSKTQLKRMDQIQDEAMKLLFGVTKTSHVMRYLLTMAFRDKLALPKVYMNISKDSNHPLHSAFKITAAHWRKRRPRIVEVQKTNTAMKLIAMRLIKNFTNNISRRGMLYLLNLPTIAYRYKLALLEEYMKISKNSSHELQSASRRPWMAEAEKIIQKVCGLHELRHGKEWVDTPKEQSLSPSVSFPPSLTLSFIFFIILSFSFFPFSLRSSSANLHVPLFLFVCLSHIISPSLHYCRVFIEVKRNCKKQDSIDMDTKVRAVIDKHSSPGDIVIYTDGSVKYGSESRWAFTAQHMGVVIKEDSGSFNGTTSSMTMEVMAVSKALEWAAEQGFTHVVIVSDCLPMLERIEKHKLRSEWVDIIGRSHLTSITWIYTPAHAGVKGNERADHLAKNAPPCEGRCMDRDDIINAVKTSLVNNDKSQATKQLHNLGVKRGEARQSCLRVQHYQKYYQLLMKLKKEREEGKGRRKGRGGNRPEASD